MASSGHGQALVESRLSLFDACIPRDPCPREHRPARVVPDPALPPCRARRRRRRSTPSTTSRPRCRWARASWRRRWSAPDRPGRRRARRRFELAAGEAFGERNPELLQRVKRGAAARTGRPRRRLRASATWCSSPRPTARAAMPAWCARWAPTGCCSTSTTRWPASRCSFEVQADRGAVMSRTSHRRSAAGRAARLLRRRGPRDRDRRARAAQVRRADLRAPRDRAQHLRGQRPQGQGRDLHRGPGRRAARRHAGVQRPRREPGGARRGRASAASRCSTPPARW